MKSSTNKEALLLLTHLIEFVYRLLWGDLFTLPVGGGIGISPMVVLLFTAGIWFTLRTRLLPVRLFRDMIAAVCEKNQNKEGLSSFQTLVVSTATRVGMGNLVGVVGALPPLLSSPRWPRNTASPTRSTAAGAAARPTTCTHWLSVGAAKNSGTRSRRRCLRCRA